MCACCRSLNKDYRERPTYDALLRHPFVSKFANEDVANVAKFFSEVLEAQIDTGGGDAAK